MQGSNNPTKKAKKEGVSSTTESLGNVTSFFKTFGASAVEKMSRFNASLSSSIESNAQQEEEIKKSREEQDLKQLHEEELQNFETIQITSSDQFPPSPSSSPTLSRSASPSNIVEKSEEDSKQEELKQQALKQEDSKKEELKNEHEQKQGDSKQTVETKQESKKENNLPSNILVSEAKVYEFSDCFIIQPISSNLRNNNNFNPNLYLCGDRKTGKITECEWPSNKPQSSIITTFTIYGLIGILNILSRKSLIAITNRKEAMTIQGSYVAYLITKVEFLPLYMLDGEDDPFDVNLKYGIQDLLEFNFYFSYNYDITRNIQNLTQQDFEHRNLPLWQRVDKRFFWNFALLNEFIQKNFAQWILPIMDGYISENRISINSTNIKYILISRRSCRRTGTRYLTRGADLKGDVANFVETEQIVEREDLLSSFVVIRGSIPVLWSQRPSSQLDLRPTPKVIHSPFTKSALKKHLEDLNDHYGQLVLINLVDHSGREAELGAHFERYVRLLHLENQYISFDFHEKSKKNSAQLTELLEHTKSFLNKFEYTLTSIQNSLHEAPVQQKGVFRVNCVDGLDRTNVVQSALSSYILSLQLHNLGVIQATELVENYLEFQTIFKNAWTGNANILSKKYAGTDALKTDINELPNLLKGQRGFFGLVNDGVKSLKRMVINRFQDDGKQLIMDLILGRFSVEKLPEIKNTQFIWTINSIDTKSETPFPGYLRIIPLEKKLVNYVLPEKDSQLCEKREYSLDTIKKIEKSELNSTMILITPEFRSEPKKFCFKSPLKREKFISQIYELVPRLHAKLENPIRTFFLAFWYMRFLRTAPTLDHLKTWIPLDKDILYIAVQDCDYFVEEKDFCVQKATEHWLFLLYEYLGEEFQSVVVSSSFETGSSTLSVLFVRNSLISNINSVRTSRVFQKTFRANSRGRILTANEKVTCVGSSIIFQIEDTSFCFINSASLSEAGSFFLEGHNNQLQRFSQVFWLGKAELKESWTELFFKENTRQGIFWSSCNDTSLAQIISSAIEGTPGGTQLTAPFFVSFAANIPQVPPLYRPGQQLTIFLTNVQIDGSFLEKATNIYLGISGQFLEEEEYRLPVDRSTLIAPNPIQLKLMFNNSGYLQTRHLLIRCSFTDPLGIEQVGGYAVIRLGPLFKDHHNNNNNSLGVPESTVSFHSNIYLDTLVSGTIKGTLKVVTFVEPTPSNPQVHNIKPLPNTFPPSPSARTTPIKSTNNNNNYNTENH